MPYVYGLVLAAIIVRHLAAGRVTPSALWSTGPVNTVLILAAIGLGLAGSYLSASALKGRSLPDEAPLGGEPLGLTINGRFPVRNDRIRVSAP